MRSPRALFVAAALALLAVPAVASAQPTPQPDTDGRFTLAVVPDTQYLIDYEQGVTRSDARPVAEAFEWIVENREERDIAFTAALGDITEHGTAEEMAGADEVYRVLDEAEMPYSVLAGNHDVRGDDDTRPDTPYLDVFGPERVADLGTLGGSDPTGYNTFHVFSGGGRQWLLLALDWRMSDASFAWAQQVIDEHPQLPVILTSHELVLDGGDGVAAFSGYGQGLWDRLIEDNDQVFLAMGGHFWPTARASMENAAGNPVELDLVNYQEQYYGGAGMIRLYTFDLTAHGIDVETFSPWAERERAEGNPLAGDVARPTRAIDRAVDQFSLEIDFAERFAGFAPAPGRAAAAPVEASLVEGTVAYWRLGDTGRRRGQDGRPVPAGTPGLADLSGRGNDLRMVTPEGTPRGSLVYRDDADPQQPGAGSLEFTTNQASYLQTVPGAPLEEERFEDGYTIEAFVRLPEDCCSGDRQWMGILSRLATGADEGKTGGWSTAAPIATLSVSPSRQLQWEMYPTNLPTTLTNWGHEMEDEVWRHVAVVNDGSTTTVYVDGAPIARNPSATSVGIDGDPSPWLVGASSFDGEVEKSFAGRLGDVRIAERALSPQEWLTAGR
ncbi:LamG-like jellyroll fold domain-containing protein [Auraticoccus monumenti]|uniref:Calcineurin-like phosphoesterase n=1 Tax=Auraticoccus monumenti TaxID=675864 RepID=A0A1G7A0D2_9ACTN|nr:LamG-like jellyroll fold domain-containing protein [Auraticoccus monumenti]SDE08398.1 Calcineurin-like phosphoesterase [Auraticoccus monumenti]